MPRRALEFSSNAQLLPSSVFAVDASVFFECVNAMAAIFRANVRRAISGFMPLSSKAT